MSDTSIALKWFLEDENDRADILAVLLRLHCRTSYGRALRNLGACVEATVCNSLAGILTKLSER